jgi:hypothetical protein
MALIISLESTLLGHNRLVLAAGINPFVSPIAGSTMYHSCMIFLRGSQRCLPIPLLFFLNPHSALPAHDMYWSRDSTSLVVLWEENGDIEPLPTTYHP